MIRIVTPSLFDKPAASLKFLLHTNPHPMAFSRMYYICTRQAYIKRGTATNHLPKSHGRSPTQSHAIPTHSAHPTHVKPNLEPRDKAPGSKASACESDRRPSRERTRLLARTFQIRVWERLGGCDGWEGDWVCGDITV
jgi:hypothetical protein